MGELADSFDTLADSNMWSDVAILFGAFLAGIVARNLIEPNLPWARPDEGYAVAVSSALAASSGGSAWPGWAAGSTPSTSWPCGSG